MRLNKSQAEYAARELIEILKNFPNGLPSKDLIGTPRFHGYRTLTSRQIHRVLRNHPKVELIQINYGYVIQSRWQLKE
jgi:hypothetical protein